MAEIKKTGKYFIQFPDGTKDEAKTKYMEEINKAMEEEQFVVIDPKIKVFQVGETAEEKPATTAQTSETTQTEQSESQSTDAEHDKEQSKENESADTNNNNDDSEGNQKQQTNENQVPGSVKVTVDSPVELPAKDKDAAEEFVNGTD